VIVGENKCWLAISVERRSEDFRMDQLSQAIGMVRKVKSKSLAKLEAQVRTKEGQVVASSSIP
jgi:hypothetical protein